MISERKLNQYFYGFSLLHILCWTVVPTVIRYSLPMDALEGFVWGQSWQLGYDRNPWLNAWLTSLAVKIGGQSGWLVYLSSQLLVFISFWAVFKLGKKILSPMYALIAVLLLEGVQYYTIAAVDLNDNVLEIGLWAISILYYYTAVKDQRIGHWVLCGLFLSLAFMAKYYTVMLLAAMLMFLLSTKEGRNSFKRAGIYIGVSIFALLVLPHLIWLVRNDFITLHYAMNRVSETYSWNTSVLHFGLAQIISFLAPLAIFGIFFSGHKGAHKPLNSYDKKFLLIMSFIPLLLTIAFAFIFHRSLHVMWGMPLLSLWGLTLVAFIQPKITERRFYLFLLSIFIIFSSILIGYSYSIMYRGNKSSANYPAQEIANYVILKWQMMHPDRKFSYVVGDRYTAGNVAYFIKNKAKACIIEDNINTCPADDILKLKGAVFIWRMDPYPNQALLDKLKFVPDAKKIAIKKFFWKRNLDKDPLTIALAFL